MTKVYRSGFSTCSVTGCDREHYAKRLCSLHYNRMARRGTVDDDPRDQHRKVYAFIEGAPYQEIPLTQGLVALVDTDLYPLLMAHRWCTRDGYAVRQILDRRMPGGQRTLRMHHAVLALRGIEMPTGAEVDHINRNRSDNRSENLRVVSHQVNTMNVGAHRNNTSGVKGVCWDKDERKWRAKITINGRRHNLGRYATIKDAASAYQSAFDAALERMLLE